MEQEETPGDTTKARRRRRQMARRRRPPGFRVETSQDRPPQLNFSNIVSDDAIGFEDSCLTGMYTWDPSDDLSYLLVPHNSLRDLCINDGRDFLLGQDCLLGHQLSRENTANHEPASHAPNFGWMAHKFYFPSDFEDFEDRMEQKLAMYRALFLLHDPQKHSSHGPLEGVIVDIDVGLGDWAREMCELEFDQTAWPAGEADPLESSLFWKARFQTAEKPNPIAADDIRGRDDARAAFAVESPPPLLIPPLQIRLATLVAALSSYTAIR